MLQKKILFSSIALVLVIMASGYLLYNAEVITLIAKGDLPVGRSPVLPPNANNLLATLRADERVEVAGCEDIKTDVVVRLRLSSGKFGYVAGGPYILARERPTFRLLFSDPKQGLP